MDFDDQRYKGSHSYKIDPKNRVSILSAWRGEPGAPLFLLFSRDHGLPLVKVLTREAYQYRVDVINDSDKAPGEKTRLLAKLALLCREAVINEQGKLLVPRELSEQAEIKPDSDVVLAGRGQYFEIWSKPNFDTYHAIITGEEDPDDLGIF